MGHRPRHGRHHGTARRRIGHPRAPGPGLDLAADPAHGQAICHTAPKAGQLTLARLCRCPPDSSHAAGLRLGPQTKNPCPRLGPGP
ncbi:hypothetical protein ARTHRO8AJ_410113 [Arthrobacter sp. 8AJ]|nr:hypothetical protein ARTHRO8AJ_410113 [Arthrobacter sp. 8AJ]